MLAEDVRQIIAEELLHIPKGNPRQNLFRAVYSDLRASHLSESESKERGETLREAVVQHQRTTPGFVSEYDREDFSDQG